MTGLLVKDIAILKGRRSQMLIFLGVMVLMGFSFDTLGLVGYGTMLLSIFTIGTLSYDEHDNCMPLLLSLPLTKKDYVKEKFAICIGGVCLGWFLSFVIALVISLLKGEGLAVFGMIYEALAMIPVFAVIVGLMIPAQIKYGAEKSRLIMVVAAGAMFAVLAILGQLTGDLGAAIDQALGRIPDFTVLLGFVAIGAAVVFAAYKISISVINKKEF